MKIDAASGTLYKCNANLFLSPACAYQAPETDFPSAYCMFLFEGYNCSTHKFVPISAVLIFMADSWPQPNLTLSTKRET